MHGLEFNKCLTHLIVLFGSNYNVVHRCSHTHVHNQRVLSNKFFSSQLIMKKMSYIPEIFLNLYSLSKNG